MSATLTVFTPRFAVSSGAILIARFSPFFSHAIQLGDHDNLGLFSSVGQVDSTNALSKQFPQYGSA